MDASMFGGGCEGGEASMGGGFASLGDAFLADPLTPVSSRQSSRSLSSSPSSSSPAASAAASVVDVLRTLPSVVHALLAGLAGEGDEALMAAGPHFQAEQLLALERLEERLAAEKLRRLAVFDRMGGALAVRSSSTKGFLRTHAQMSQGRANRLVVLARELDRLPVVRDAQAAGVLSADQGEVLARELAPVDDPRARAEAAVLMVEHAPRLHLVQVRQAARQLHAHLVPERDGEGVGGGRAARPFQSWVRLSQTGTTSDPFWVVSGELSPLVGEKLRTALEAAMGTPVEGESRTHAERMGDALGVVTDLALGCGALPVTGGQRPHLTLIADLDALRARACPAHPAL
ncbi:DUF222 domain-containing protein, partial [Streptacidiphilus pinicola]|uniref:DUF222 domain-containing protein n=1 Tax=Streptacidiphilus pinicola TaxID=2219663 RepID=UPI001058318D